MKKVLVPINESEASLRVINVLVSERARYGIPADAEIHLLNVQAPVSGNVESFINHEQIKQYHREESLKVLKPARDMLDAAGVSYIFHIGVGDPAEIIARYAKDQGCEQIIMGTRHESNLAGMLLGSVARDVTRLSKVPVLLVK